MVFPPAQGVGCPANRPPPLSAPLIVGVTGITIDLGILYYTRKQDLRETRSEETEEEPEPKPAKKTGITLDTLE